MHGRGGQGTVTMAALLVDAAFRSGWQALGFPAFGTERTGAPVAAFARLDRSVIRDRGEVTAPKVVVVQDPTLVGAVNLLEGLAPGGIVLVNATAAPEGLAAAPTLLTIPATELAREHLGDAKTSTAMLGFLAGATRLIETDAVEAAIRDRFRGEVADRNVALARAAHDVGAGQEVAA